MENCLFCEIIKGRLPAYKFWEDEEFLAFLDINPLNPGHTLVIPKKHYRWVLEVKEFADYWETAGKIAKKLKQTLSADSINFVTLGYEMEHAHIHVIPRFDNDDLGSNLDWTKTKKLSDKELQILVQNLRGGVFKCRQ